MEIYITKKDIIWSYLAQFFNLATGLITLPLMLKILSPEEVGFNYILMSVSSIVVLFDMGFSGQFSRYLTYIFSGAQKIQKEGIPNEYSEQINEHLLASTIATAKRIYLYISFITFVCLIFIGSWYVYSVTDGFRIIENCFIIWFIFCISSFFNIYFLYFNAFLQGRGLVKETKQAQVLSRICQLIISFTMLFEGYGLLSIVVANFISPFVYRYFAYNKFYTNDIKYILQNNIISRAEIQDIFLALFYNAKKMGVVGILSSIIGYASTLVIGSFMTLKDVGSYGLMVQLVGIITGIATIHFTSITPKLANVMVKKDYKTLRSQFGLSMFFFICICFLGFIGLMIISPIFQLLKFNTQLPTYSVLILYCVYKFVEQNQSIYSQLFLLQNDMRFYSSAVVTGIISFFCLCISLYLGCGLFEVIALQAFPLFVYVAWKWPIEATKIFEICTINDIFINPVILIKTKIHD